MRVNSAGSTTGGVVVVLPFVVAGRPTVRPKYASAISAKCGLAGGAQGIVSRSVVT